MAEERKVLGDPITDDEIVEYRGQTPIVKLLAAKEAVAKPAKETKGQTPVP
jgi:hypothetical protein